MDNRKLIVAFYIASSALLWFMARSSLHFLYLTFYQVRRLPGIAVIREVVPIVLAGILFGVLFRHPTVNSYLEDVVSELKKVTWPSREDTIKSTTVVIICILIASFILAGFDLIWGKVITFLLHS